MLNTLKVKLIRFLYRFLTARSWKTENPELPYSVLNITTDESTLELRMYNGEKSNSRPLMIFLHGGGWVIGDLDTHNAVCQSLCLQTSCTVISVDYRLAPEYPYPAAHNDALAATRWIMKHRKELAPNNGTFILVGDSAGGNLATCTCLNVNPQERELIVGEIVIYPVTDHHTIALQDYPSYREKARGYSLTTAMMQWFWDTYLDGASVKNQPPLITTPIHAPNLSDLPATLLITAEHDPLRDEGKAYAAKLNAAGVILRHTHYEDDEHGFAATAGKSPSFNRLMSEISTWVDGLS